MSTAVLSAPRSEQPRCLCLKITKMHNNHFLTQFEGWLKKHGVPEYYSCADKKGFLRDHIMSLSLEEFATEFGYLCVRKKPGPKLTAMKKTKTSGKPWTPIEPDNTDHHRLPIERKAEA